MKQKEVWAKEYMISQIRPDASQLIKIYSQTDWLAGFEFAKNEAFNQETSFEVIKQLGEEEL